MPDTLVLMININCSFVWFVVILQCFKTGIYNQVYYICGAVNHYYIDSGAVSRRLQHNHVVLYVILCVSGKCYFL